MHIVPSKHLINDRLDRYLFIATRLGFGEVVFSKPHKTSEGAGKLSITSTGVILITGYSDTLITLYIATAGQIKQYYGDTTIPQTLLRQVYQNTKRNLIVLQDQTKSKGR